MKKNTAKKPFNINKRETTERTSGPLRQRVHVLAQELKVVKRRLDVVERALFTRKKAR